MDIDYEAGLDKIIYNDTEIKLNSEGSSCKEGELNPDFAWAKKVFEETNLDGYPYKMLELCFARGEVATFTAKTGFKILTSDGQWYEATNYSSTTITHTWNDENPKNSEYYKGEKLRWIMQFAADSSLKFDILLKYETIYFCANWLVYPLQAQTTSYNTIKTFDFFGDGKFYQGSSSISFGSYSLERLPKFERTGSSLSQSTFRINAPSLVNIEGMPDLTENDVKSLQGLFMNCYNLKHSVYFNIGSNTDLSSLHSSNYNLLTYAPLKTENVINFSSMFKDCRAIKEIDVYNTSSGQNFGSTFYDCSTLETIKNLDLINATSVSTIFRNCTNLKNLYIKNIKISLGIGAGTSYGHLLTLESLLNAIKELWDNTAGTSTLTLTVGSANLSKLANVYVKLIDITDEMRAEDPYIDNKKPFVVCGSADEGAMLITEYVTSKNWQIK